VNDKCISRNLGSVLLATCFGGLIWPTLGTLRFRG
jgi:hypothetical protein